MGRNTHKAEPITEVPVFHLDHTNGHKVIDTIVYFRTMQVANPNNIKIYNLSAGKSLPEWLSDRKKRSLQKQDGGLRKRIELIQVTLKRNCSATCYVSHS